MHPEPVSCLILEDEASSRAMIEHTLLSHFPHFTRIVCASIREAEQACQEHLPDLLMLDINLPDGLSFRWLEQLYKRDQSFSVIFTTAYAHYAVEAFKFSALDFLLKPFLPEELVNAIHKALKEIGSRQYYAQLETLFHNLQLPTPSDKKIVLKTVEEILVVNADDILAVEADNSYSNIRLKGGRSILVSQSLKEFEKRLNTSGFMRVHQSHLVQLCYICGFKKKTNMLLLEEGLSVPVSLNKRSLVMNYLNTL